LSVIKNFIITFCVSVLLFGGIAWLIVSYAVENVVPGLTNTNPSNQTNQPNNNITNPDNEPNGQTDETSDDIKLTGNTFTVLIIGTDYQPDVFDDYDLTEINKSETGFPLKEREKTADSLMLIQFNPNAKKIMLSSIPSNMKVKVEGVDVQLGSVYNYKDMKFITNLVTAYTGLKIDYYASVAIKGFINIINTIGGITYEVPVDMNYEDKTEGYKISLNKGVQNLNGDKLLQLLRYKSYANGNTTRMTVAIGVAKAVFEKLTSPENLANAYNIYNKCSEYINTDFTEAALTENIETIFAFSQFGIVEITYPGESTSSVFIPNEKEAISLYKNWAKTY